MQSTQVGEIHTTEVGSHVGQPGALGKALRSLGVLRGLRQDRPENFGMIRALQAQGKHIYAGTVDPDEIKRRRKANKVARASRRHNRR